MAPANNHNSLLCPPLVESTISFDQLEWDCQQSVGRKESIDHDPGATSSFRFSQQVGHQQTVVGSDRVGSDGSWKVGKSSRDKQAEKSESHIDRAGCHYGDRYLSVQAESSQSVGMGNAQYIITCCRQPARSRSDSRRILQTD